MKKDTLGNRMKKNYEFPFRQHLPSNSNVIVRVDGKAFHTYTKGMDKPFDMKLISAMDIASREVCRRIPGMKMAYTQSDEASFWFHDTDNIKSEPWMNNNKSKIESVVSSMFTFYFNRAMDIREPAFFDARAFTVPNVDVANYFLWRVKDWKRNSLSMLAHKYYTHQELHKKSTKDMHEMLHKKNVNWSKDLSPRLCNGLLLVENVNFDQLHTSSFKVTYEEIAKHVDPLIGKWVDDKQKTVNNCVTLNELSTGDVVYIKI